MFAPSRRPAWIKLLLVAFMLLGGLGVSLVQARHTPNPTSVTIAGDFQQELGCPGDWQPECAVTQLEFDAEDGVWQAVFNLPAGNWQYKAALNGSWTENYGAGAQRDGPNINLSLASSTDVKFYYDHKTHWVTDNVTSVIATAPGNFQSEMGCSGDWQPWCLQSWLQNPDGDAVFSFTTEKIPAGDWEVKVAHNESWDLNYGLGGVQNGPNIPFSVDQDCEPTLFEYDLNSHILTIGDAPAPPQPGFVTIPGSFQSELGCSGDWQPDCTVTHLTYDGEDGVWQGTFDLPAGNWEYKAALNNSWDENYGANATRNGPNISLNLAAPTAVKFYYSHETHWVTDNQNALIVTAPGSFQSELGCSGDWQPWCLQSWLQDPDGDGFYSTSVVLPGGDYEAKAAINESWDLNYGAGGVQNGPNIPFTVPGACTEINFVFDSNTNILDIGTAGGPAGNLNLARAHWVNEDTIAWDVPGVAPATAYALHYNLAGGMSLAADGVQGADGSLTLTHDPAGLPADVQARFPHLAGFEAFKISAGDLPLVSTALKGQIAVSALDTGSTTLLDATGVQIPGVLDDLYFYGGSLGLSWDGATPSLALWAPTAQSVNLHLFADSDPATAATVMPMSADPASGVWSISGDPGWAGQYYLYEVTVYAPSTRQVEVNLVTDPYSVSLAANSTRSQIVDLNDSALMPAGWHDLAKPPLNAPEDIALYELHIRDFSWNDASVPDAYRGTYLAFTQADSSGMRHLRALAGAGLTHVHLLPSFDVATITERRSDQIQPDEAVLATYPPDSDQQQALIESLADQDGFNWGYDPYHYNVPEGSYATNPDGAARILEYRAMVQALNQAGLRVVADVVYNHTNSAGQNAKSVLDKIVPGYYHRLSLDGVVETSTCCPNTATEHLMMEKLMLDSLRLWATVYKVDGFRFDLMGHHMLANMLRAQDVLGALTPAADGVDGAAIYIYGEGWNFGEVANGARGVNATQANVAGSGIGSFNDRIRDSVRGGGPFSGLQEQGFATGLYYDPNATNQGSPALQRDRLLLLTDLIRVSLAGNLADYMLVDRFGNLVPGSALDYNGQPAGYTQDPQEIINYVSAHDNETWFDAVQLKAPLGTSMADRVRVHNLGLSVVALSQGVPFFHAGSDMLRSKDMDRDSFNSGDWFNRLDFTYQSNNWGVGLPVASKNLSNWPIMQPLLANPDLRPAPAHIQAAVANFQEMLAIRRSSPLFRLQTEAQVMAHLGFLNTGPAQLPGLIVMSLSDDAGAIDRTTELIVVLFNANDDPVVFNAPQWQGWPLGLHPVQRNSADPVVRTAAFDPATGAFSVPARTTAVFVAKRPVTEQLSLVMGDVASLQSAGVLNAGQANALTAKLREASRRLRDGQTGAGRNQLTAFLNQVNALAQAGILSDGQTAALTRAVQDAIDCLNAGAPVAALPLAGPAPALMAVPALLPGLFWLIVVWRRREAPASAGA